MNNSASTPTVSWRGREGVILGMIRRPGSGFTSETSFPKRLHRYKIIRVYETEERQY